MRPGGVMIDGLDGYGDSSSCTGGLLIGSTWSGAYVCKAVSRRGRQNVPDRQPRRDEGRVTLCRHLPEERIACPVPSAQEVGRRCPRGAFFFLPVRRHGSKLHHPDSEEETRGTPRTTKKKHVARSC